VTSARTTRPRLAGRLRPTSHRRALSHFGQVSRRSSRFLVAVWAAADPMLCPVAVVAKDLEPVRPSALAKVAVEARVLPRCRERASVFGAVVVDVVERQEDKLSLATADAFRHVGFAVSDKGRPPQPCDSLSVDPFLLARVGLSPGDAHLAVTVPALRLPPGPPWAPASEGECFKRLRLATAGTGLGGVIHNSECTKPHRHFRVATLGRQEIKR
jgi:hypothetical protein